MAKKKPTDRKLLSSFFPESGRELLTGSGKQFVEQIGVITIREAVYRVMLGENVRTQTEPLSRRRHARVSGAIVAMLTEAHLANDKFGEQLPRLAVEQLQAGPKSNKAVMWPAQWLLGLNNKAVQNVLRSDTQAIDRYVHDFEEALRDAARHCQDQLGDYRMTLAHHKGKKSRKVELGWGGIAQLTTAIGAQTLALRGSDKSMYGKLFERLVLGSFLTLMGFERVDPKHNKKDCGVFWLSDRSGERESDATLLIEPGKLARFDIGFIGLGNPEITKDKLSRLAREIEHGGVTSSSVTFVIVDSLPKSGTTEKLAEKLGTGLVQMSMQFWPRSLAKSMRDKVGVKHRMAKMSDPDLRKFLKEEMDKIQVQDFLSGVTVQDLEKVAPAESESGSDEEG
ncbi:MAG: CfrBI family restriction endonuclease [Planctomycetia bacterium]|nr:CfrBI family restriction endonuclease [Planctomycetia bacterium]